MRHPITLALASLVIVSTVVAGPSWGSILDLSPTTWLKADNVSSGIEPGAGQLGTWFDSAGNTSASQGVSTNQPSLLLNQSEFNDQAVVHFGAAVSPNDFMDIAQAKTVNTAFFAIRTVSLPQDWAGYLTTNTGSSNFDTNNILNMRNGVDLLSNATSSQTRFGGTFPTTANIVSLTNFTTTSFANLRLGRDRSVTNRYLDGDIAEVILFPTALTAAERIVVTNYLGSKYNIGNSLGGGDTEIPSDDYYAGDKADQNDYDFDVLGIGRAADASVVSTGENAGLRITANPADIDTNEWLFAGHKSTSNSIMPLELTEGLTSGDRWERLWYADATGSFATDLSFEFTAGGIAGLFDDSDNFSLLFREPNSLDWTVLSYDPTVNIGMQSVLFSLPTGLSDGYYTLGVNVVQAVPEPSSLLLLGFGASGLIRQTRRRRSVSHSGSSRESRDQQ